MNKKGFTLIEILATLLILSIIMGLAAIAYSSIVNRTKQKSFETYENTMYSETMELMINALSDPTKGDLFPRIGETKRFSLTDIGIEPFRNPVNKDDLCTGSYVEVTRNESGSPDELNYKVCLKCPNSNYDNCKDFPLE